MLSTEPVLVQQGSAPRTPLPAVACGAAPQQALLEWYAHHRRDLPWRRQPDPYRVLISEVMLQQTQVDRVVAHFARFVERFPSFAALAAAPRAEVIRAWAGLGYNRRAVQLHTIAEIVMERHGGALPADREALLALPGIGPYTAGAILSIAFGQDEPALDTNATRVIRRYCFGGHASEADVRNAARAMIPTGRAGEWNQALMDLGSSLCTARRPRCLICPLQPGCASAGRIDGENIDAQNKVGLSRKREAPFPGSTRYYRGRLLAELRALPVGADTSVDELQRALGARGVAEPPGGWLAIGRQLERDGLVSCRETPDGVVMRLA